MYLSLNIAICYTELESKVKTCILFAVYIASSYYSNNFILPSLYYCLIMNIVCIILSWFNYMLLVILVRVLVVREDPFVSAVSVH